MTQLASGKLIPSDAVLYAAGRQGATGALELENAGLEADARGRIAVNESYQTAKPHIYAVGDVIGFPSLAVDLLGAGTARRLHAFGVEARTMRDAAAVRHLHDPRDLHGRPQRGGADRRAPCRTSSASPATARSRAARSRATRMACSSCSSRPRPRQVLGVHIFGSAAAELVHIGQAVIAMDGTVDYLIDTVFNYPTFAEAYKVAALDAMNRLNELSVARKVA